MDSKTIRQVMSTQLTTVTQDDALFEVAVAMKRENTGFIPVVGKGNELVGVITDRDLVIRGLAEKKPGSTKVSEIMSDRSLYAIPPETTIEDAAKLMAKEQVRRLPIVEGKTLIGIVSLGDLAVRTRFEDAAGKALSYISNQEYSEQGSTAVGSNK